MEYSARELIQSEKLDLSNVYNGNYKPRSLCRKLEILARFRAESSHSQQVFDK